MRFIGIFITSIFLSACGVIECVDSQFERQSIAIDGESFFEILLADGKSISYAIKCEKYYDSMCAERGNSWQIREVGKSNEYKRSYLPITSESKVSYDLELPSCEEIIKLNSIVKMKDMSVVWNKNDSKTEKTELSQVTSWLGKRYHYVSTINGVHSFKYGGYRDVPLEMVKLDFTLKLNGKVVE